MIKIEKGIPVPSKKLGRKRIYPFDQMNVGDSFSFEAAKSTSVYVSAKNFATASGKNWKFTVRREGRRAGTDIARIWRIA